jgi:4-hydroxy-4-methyl-2-oxoglutarate aldolase
VNISNITRLTEFDTPTVANGLELLGALDPTVGYTGPDVRALMPEMGVRVGIAVTARLDTTTAGTDRPPTLFRDWMNLMVKTAHTADGLLPVFAVMESVGPRARYTVTIGDGMGRAMRIAGCVGFASNGCIRDIEGVRALDLPCWAAGLSPMHGRLRWLDVGSPVVIDGMTVRTGDIIHADVNGVLCIPAGLADQVLEKALAVREREAGLFAKWDKPGVTLDDYFAAVK